jgi:hypothetical protein
VFNQYRKADFLLIAICIDAHEEEVQQNGVVQ